jgi:hypothetical protein
MQQIKKYFFLDCKHKYMGLNGMENNCCETSGFHGGEYEV